MDRAWLRHVSLLVHLTWSDTRQLIHVSSLDSEEGELMLER